MRDSMGFQYKFLIRRVKIYLVYICKCPVHVMKIVRRPFAEIIAQEQQMDSIKLKFTLQIRKHSISLHYGKAALADLESYCLSKINSAKNKAPSGLTCHQMEALTPKTLYWCNIIAVFVKNMYISRNLVNDRWGRLAARLPGIRCS